ncbi:hypothetical protein [Haemophilus haemolyticus]|uniref:hypothetical protein n=1 Tax=Haemophilus haemolyticus TaxID=726 RepID=UPI000E57E766|nr:hypothetical protein [Haemophilus haemolyticus]
MAKNEKTLLAYKVTVIDGNGVVASEIIPGNSKAQVQQDNKYQHCYTDVKFIGRVKISLEPTSCNADEATIKMQSKKTSAEIEFNENSYEGMNDIQAQINRKGHQYLIDQTAQLRSNLQRELDKYSDSENE